MSQILASRPDHTPFVKLCGMRRDQDVQAAVEVGADLAGIVFAESKRRVSVEQARSLVAAARGKVTTVGVFVGFDVADINRVAAATAIDMAQIADAVAPANLELLTVPYIATVHVRHAMLHSDVLHIVNAHRHASALLVDSWSALGGGSGVAADWAVAKLFVETSSIPVFLAGGLSPDTVCDAIDTVRPAGVDVSSGIEIGGWKDPDLMRRFVECARSTGGRTAPVATPTKTFGTSLGASR